MDNVSPLEVIGENDHILFSVKPSLRLKVFIYLGQSSEGLVLSLLVSLLCRPYDVCISILLTIWLPKIHEA